MKKLVGKICRKTNSEDDFQGFSFQSSYIKNPIQRIMCNKSIKCFEERCVMDGKMQVLVSSFLKIWNLKLSIDNWSLNINFTSLEDLKKFDELSFFKHKSFGYNTAGKERRCFENRE